MPDDRVASATHDIDIDRELDAHRFVFIGGLHRSGTSLLFQLLREHPDASAFRDTGVKEDEGQHLQSVYKPARLLGGEGSFGFHPEAHMVEVDAFRARADARALVRDWSPHWDMTREVLVEKSPPNLVRTRYLQSLFPDARFVMLLRHPVEVVLAERRRRKTTPLGPLLRHWFTCYEQLLDDARHLDHVLAVRYEDLLAEPQRMLDATLSFVGLEPTPSVTADAVAPERSARYRQQWSDLRRRPLSRPYARRLINRFESRANAFGYSLEDLDHRGDWSLQAS